MTTKQASGDNTLKRTMCEVMNYEPYLTMDNVMKILATKVAEGSLSQYVVIRHDKDVVSADDVERAPHLQLGALKAPHIHAFLKFPNSRKFDEIANWFGIEPQFVHKISATTYEKAVLYATHTNAPDKYQYQVTEARASFDFAALVRKYKEKEIKTAEENARDARKLAIIAGIMNGTITESTLSQYVTAPEEDRFNSSIRNTFARKKRELVLIKDRNMKVIYICGAAGSGKTTLAKMICAANGFTYFISGSKRDPLQGLSPETDVIILDDLSPDCFEWKELLKLLDNHTASAAAARFSDKYVNCKMIIITNTKGIEDFASMISGSFSEDRYQFYRRVTTVYNIFPETIEQMELDPKTRQYKKVKTTKNRTQEYIKQSPKEEQEIDTDPDDIFGKLL